MDKKTKVLLVQEKIHHYNVGVFYEISKKCNFTAIISEKPGFQLPFNAIFIPMKGKYIKKHHEDISDYAKSYDVVILSLQLSHFYTFKLLFSKHKYKIILWGIGVAAGYKIKYDSSIFRSTIYKIMINKANAVIFYSDYPKKKYIKENVSESKLFVANNTVKINKIKLSNKRNDFLFIGTLYKEKMVDLLIMEYLKAYKMNNKIPVLRIIGDGPEKENLKKMISYNKLQNKVELLGQITDENVLKKYYNKTLLSISLGQAGLSVQKSMGYGTVFITKKDAITGGEIFDIKNYENGILLDNNEQLINIMLDTINNRRKYIQIANNAYDFYWKNRTIDKKINGFIDAIEYVLNQK